MGFLPLGTCPHTLAEIAGDATDDDPDEVVYYVTDPDVSRRQPVRLIDDCAELW